MRNHEISRIRISEGSEKRERKMLAFAQGQQMSQKWIIKKQSASTSI
jgi:hypothetical protein